MVSGFESFSLIMLRVKRSQNNSDEENVVDGLVLDMRPSKAVFTVPGQSNTFTIDIKTLTGKTLKVDINDGTTVAWVKNEIQKLEGIPPDEQRLTFDGKFMTDGEFLGLKKEVNALTHL